MTAAYLMYLAVLSVSPVLAKFGLNYIYPDVKTFIKSRRWTIAIVFGLAAYVPAAAIAVSEAVVPMYSPFGATPVWFDSEGNAVFMMVLFLGVFVINASIVDFFVLRRRNMTVVGIPKQVIRYSIDKEIAKAKQDTRERDIHRITTELEGMLKEDTDVKPLLQKIRMSVAKERGMGGEEMQKFIAREQIELPTKTLPAVRLKEERRETLFELGKAISFEKVKDAEAAKTEAAEAAKAGALEAARRANEIQAFEAEKTKAARAGAAGIEQRVRAAEAAKGAGEAAPGEEEVVERKGLGGLFGRILPGGREGAPVAEKPAGKKPLTGRFTGIFKRGAEAGGAEEANVPGGGETAETAKDAEARRLREAEITSKLRDMVVAGRAEAAKGRAAAGAAAKAPKAAESDELMGELERKLKQTTASKADRTQELLDQLKERLGESQQVAEEGPYVGEDVMEITEALKSMREGAEAGKPGRKHGGREETKLPESGISREAAFAAEGRKHGRPRGEGEDLLSAMIGDVRQQLVEPKREEKGKTGAKWYEEEPAKEAEDAKPAAAGGMFPAAAAPAGGGIELFEKDMSFDEAGMGLGDLGGLGEGLGGLGNLEDLSQGLESTQFDGMFVDVGETKKGCPNCGKKGTSIVYCSNCGKPLCSNCASAVEGSEGFVKYKCPHCSEEFAMKRRQ